MENVKFKRDSKALDNRDPANPKEIDIELEGRFDIVEINGKKELRPVVEWSGYGKKLVLENDKTTTIM